MTVRMEERLRAPRCKEDGKKIISFVSMLALNYTNLVEKRGKKRSGEAAALPASITASLYPWMLWPELQL